ncbi:hypothetical protein EJF18_30095 [Clavispora lusitaniae]|uniref:Uncharacterized protein n=1 Tax=Clavispora lusitaniae TaxID=36911 RepID=A0ACD0WHX3_CLALS|nr:hypothetical protein EJF14_30095 [Clavispora lusitaniae]QFZ33554.1 hypothetical protein EJF16_30095 [Clavispora lusitaniae]QFZ39225.1 hypothetical protein EJF15_30095 [Clavispora lusitaniae]QFZ44907.1 hypothetical protein EJF18_30095 [Clavispora lusitaniae]QFZ50584.1 hypothetical protein EJF17_30095 [Clavispora lusitaniae]
MHVTRASQPHSRMLTLHSSPTMAENFERHKSTRWVRNSVPSYGDAWEDEYGDYDYEATPSHPDSTSQLSPQQTGSIPEKAASGSTLVLSIDKLKSHAEDGEDDDSEEDEEAEIDQQTNDRQPQTQRADPPKAEQAAALPPINSATPQDSSFAPPTPTFSTHQQSHAPPDTPQSEHSFVSDADSIQREPEHLNMMPAPQLNEIVEEPKSATHLALMRETSSATRLASPAIVPHATSPAPESLILSIDRMNLDDSSDNDDSDDDFRDSVNDNKNDQFSFGNDKANVSSDEDDWGYNSQHSSNDEGDDLDVPHETEEVAPAKHHIKTDALDSLISDLSKMEKQSTMFDKNPVDLDEADANMTENNDNNIGSDSTDNYSFENAKAEEKDTSTVADTSGIGKLPSLNSIHEFSLPDFQETSFTAEEGPVPKLPVLPESNKSVEDFKRQHEDFVSNVSTRNSSLRKAPPILDHTLLSNKEVERHGSNTDLDKNPPDVPSKQDAFDSFSKKGGSFDSSIILPPPVPRGADALSRRESTASQQTFNMGNWKPNTSIYRDKFVTDNDMESQMNMSIFNNDETNYSKFTGMKSEEVYSSSRSVLSVPETVDAYLPSIHETGSDDEEEGERKNSDNTLESKVTTNNSVLKDHSYDQARFEEMDPSSDPSTEDNTLESKDIENQNRLSKVSDGSANTSTERAREDASTLAEHAKPIQQGYPVFNWKKIMSISQPTDRIDSLRRAKEDEANYDTGLNYWLTETLRSSSVAPNIQIGKIATQAYQNAQHGDLKRHTSIRSKVSLVKDKMEAGNFGLQATSLGRKFLSRGKKLMKSNAE